MSPKGQVYLFAILFAFTGLCLTIYKASVLHFPLLPNTERKVWSVEAKINFDAIGDPVTVNLALPETQQQFSILDEVFASAGYGFNMQDGDHRRASWTRNTVRGPQTLYYKLEVTEKLEKVLPADSPLDEEIVQPVWTQVEKVAAESLIRSARELSADPGSFTLQLLKMMSGQSASQDALLLQQTSGGQSTAQLALKLLAEAGITARMVRGIYLENRLYNQK